MGLTSTKRLFNAGLFVGVSSASPRVNSIQKGLILAGYYTGGRLSDLARLKWSNVDLSEDEDGPKGKITFYQQKTEAKMGQKAKVETPIHPEVQEYLVASAGIDNPNAPVFPELYDKLGPGKSGLSMAFKRIMERAGIDGGLIRVSYVVFSKRRGLVTNSTAAAAALACVTCVGQPVTSLRNQLVGRSREQSQKAHR